MRRLALYAFAILATLLADQAAVRAHPSEEQLAAFLKVAQEEKDAERKSVALQDVADLHARFGNLEKALEILALAGLQASPLKNAQETLRRQAVDAIRWAGDHKRALEATAGLHPMIAASAHFASARALLAAGRKSEAAELLKGIRYESGRRLVIGSGIRAIAMTGTTLEGNLVIFQAKAGLAQEAAKVFALLEAVMRK